MKFLDIRRDEVAKVWITWTMVALISIGYAIGWSAVHSMLVKRMGVEYLPYTYIGISVLGMIGPAIVLVASFTVAEKLLYVGLATMVAVSVWDFVSPANRRCGPEGCEVAARHS